MLDIPEEIQLAVKKGSNELTERYPGWYNAVVLEDLDMASSQACVLAHVAEYIGESMIDGYYTMLNLLFPTDGARTLGFMEEQTEWAKDNGFCEDDRQGVNPFLDEDGEYQSRWVFMDEAWTQHIKELRDIEPIR